MRKEESGPFELRVYFFLLLSAAITGLYTHSEKALLAMFSIVIIWKFLAGQTSNVLVFILTYAGLWGITRTGFHLLAKSPDLMIAAFMSNTGVSGRKAMLPIIFATLLAGQPTGSLIAAFSAMRMPKSVGIGLAVMLRFFPTLGQEFRAIRAAQKFRGVGVGFWNTISHIPRVMSYIVIPLCIRITRISDELSASLTVRGVRFNNEIISFRPVQFSLKDGLAFAITLLAQIMVLIIDFFKVPV